jgi:hypothetical protein
LPACFDWFTVVVVGVEAFAGEGHMKLHGWGCQPGVGVATAISATPAAAAAAAAETTPAAAVSCTCRVSPAALHWSSWQSPSGPQQYPQGAQAA